MATGEIMTKKLERIIATASGQEAAKIDNSLKRN